MVITAFSLDNVQYMVRLLLTICKCCHGWLINLETDKDNCIPQKEFPLEKALANFLTNFIMRCSGEWHLIMQGFPLIKVYKAIEIGNQILTISGV